VIFQGGAIREFAEREEAGGDNGKPRVKTDGGEVAGVQELQELQNKSGTNGRGPAQLTFRQGRSAWLVTESDPDPASDVANKIHQSRS
jgi:hypothetical protein